MTLQISDPAVAAALRFDLGDDVRHQSSVAVFTLRRGDLLLLLALLPLLDLLHSTRLARQVDRG